MSSAVVYPNAENEKITNRVVDPLLDKVFAAVSLPPTSVQQSQLDVESSSILAELDQVLERHSNVRSESESTLPAESQRTLSDLSEEIDDFPVDVDRASLLRFAHLPSRSRSQTIDSQVSAAESRFGSFDINDEEGKFKNSQIDLFHNEVAYQRPKRSKTKKIETPQPPRRSLIVSQNNQEHIYDNVPVEENGFSVQPNGHRYSIRSEDPNSRRQSVLKSEPNSRHHSVLKEEPQSRRQSELKEETQSRHQSVLKSEPPNSRRQSVLKEEPQSRRQSVLKEDENSRRRSVLSQQSHRQSTLTEQPDNEPFGSPIEELTIEEEGIPVEAPHPTEYEIPEAEHIYDEPASEAGDLHDQSEISAETPKSQIDVETIPYSDILVYQLERAELISERNGFGLIRPQVEIFSHPKFPRIIIGGSQNPTENDKVILLVGKSESGKSTLIYSILNYLYSVSKEYDFRFAITPPNEITKTSNQIIEYTFNNSILPYSVTIVDTPGLEVESTVPLIREWVQRRLQNDDRLRLDAFAIVSRHDDPAPSSQMITRFRQLEWTFGGDLRSNVWPFVTFGDKLGKSLTVEFLQKTGLFFEQTFPINNVAFLPEVHSVSPLQHLIHYKAAAVSLGKFFENLETKTHPLLLVRSETHP